MRHAKGQIRGVPRAEQGGTEFLASLISRRLQADEARLGLILAWIPSREARLVLTQDISRHVESVT